MNKNESSQSKIPFRQKIALVLFGLFLFFVLLEVSLRLGGFILLSIQEHRNLQSIKQKGVYHILCLGESTTQGQYSPYLEEILNKRNIEIKFSVIDKGLMCTNTVAILLELEKNLDKYQPDIVVTMMGCNDEGIRYYQDIPESDAWLFKHCRVYRFGRIIYMHILKKLKKDDIHRVKSHCLSQGKSIEAEKSFEKITEFKPKDDFVCVGLGWTYKDQGRYIESEQVFKKAIELNPKNDSAYAGLGWLYKDQGRYAESEPILKKAIELNPKNDSAYAELGRLYKNQKRYAESEQALKEVIRLNPKHDPAYVVLSLTYRDQGKFTEAEQILDKAVELNSKYDPAYVGLGQLYKEQKRYAEAEQAFKKAIELNSENELAYGGLATVYGEMGKDELSREYTDKLNNLRGGYYNLITINNYRKLKQILDKRKIRLVCVQYPMRSIQPLKKIFREDENTIFVDNDRIFKDAVRKEGYSEYFVDIFGGDFGHCTQKGNRLLARNIANAILKEIFGK